MQEEKNTLPYLPSLSPPCSLQVTLKNNCRKNGGSKMLLALEHIDKKGFFQVCVPSMDSSHLLNSADLTYVYVRAQVSWE